MDTIKDRAEQLLKRWCEGLLVRQISQSGDPRLDGALACGCCAKIHGRCGDAMYPFLAMAARGGGTQWIDAAMKLFWWGEHTLSLADGGMLNDVDSPWTGTTVFSMIGWAQCYLVYRHVLTDEFAHQLFQRIEKAADYLYGLESLANNNINYPITNALALELAYRVTNKRRYSEKGAWFADIAFSVITEGDLIYGEGVPRSRISDKGCRSIDIGYNVEETLPALALYGNLVGNTAIVDLAKRSFKAHLAFMFADGGWDNSFGTRNFKWTWWGSRTSDGSIGGLLLFGDQEPEFARAAIKNLELLEYSTVDALLSGGPHYADEGQPACIHHTFEHASMLAQALDRGLFDAIDLEAVNTARLARELGGPSRYYPELATWIVNKKRYTATLTAYDWQYLEGGHVSGGTLSALFDHSLGPIFAASMGEYSLKERNNMQVPTEGVIHQCLAPRIEYIHEGETFSSIYECDATTVMQDDRYTAGGFLWSKDGKGGSIPYELSYEFSDHSLLITATAMQGSLVLPLISRSHEEIVEGPSSLDIIKGEGKVCLAFDSPYQLAYGTKRIFNLVPGLQALRIDLPLEAGQVSVQIVLSEGGEL